MKFFAIASALVAAAGSATASVTQGCVTSKQANLLVSRFSAMLSHVDSDLGDPLTTGKAILTKEYKEYSDSILSLANRAGELGGVTFSGRTTYLEGLMSHPPVTGINTLGIYISGCSKVLWQWQFTGVGTAEYPVKGFSLFTLNRKNLVVKTEIEFNSVAWGIDTHQLPCGSPPESSSAPAE